jgi:hypothetical protein
MNFRGPRQSLNFFLLFASALVPNSKPFNCSYRANLIPRRSAATCSGSAVAVVIVAGYEDTDARTKNGTSNTHCSDVSQTPLISIDISAHLPQSKNKPGISDATVKCVPEGGDEQKRLFISHGWLVFDLCPSIRANAATISHQSRMWCNHRVANALCNVYVRTNFSDKSWKLP